jgi:hypothetical protein
MSSNTRFTIIFSKLEELEAEQSIADAHEHERTVIKYDEYQPEFDEIYELVRLADAMEEPDMLSYSST